MAIITGGKIIEGTLGPIQIAGAPGAGTNEVQTATFGGTGGTSTFKLSLDGQTTAAIAWSSTNATLLSNINAALDATFGASQIVATDSSLSSGLGDVLLTFSGLNYSKNTVNLMTRTIVTGALTIVIAETTAGVAATPRGLLKGGLVLDTTNGKAYINTGTPNGPTWTVVGAQS